MRILFIVGWLLVPVAVGLWHYGPGQERVQLDGVAEILARADQCVAAQDWPEAVRLIRRGAESAAAGQGRGAAAHPPGKVQGADARQPTAGGPRRFEDARRGTARR